MMLGYLSKFVLQMLPTIAATVIGAYIVTTWINPKTPPDPAKVAAQQAAKAVPAAEELAAPDVPVAPATKSLRPPRRQAGRDRQVVETPNRSRPPNRPRSLSRLRALLTASGSFRS